MQKPCKASLAHCADLKQGALFILFFYYYYTQDESEFAESLAARCPWLERDEEASTKQILAAIKPRKNSGMYISRPPQTFVQG